LRKNSSQASRPPADAPIPTTGKASPADLDGETGKEGGAGAAGGGTGGMATGARGAIFLAPFGALLGEDFEPFLAGRRLGGTRMGGWCHFGPANSTTRGRRNVETLPGTA